MVFVKGKSLKKARVPLFGRTSSTLSYRLVEHFRPGQCDSLKKPVITERDKGQHNVYVLVDNQRGMAAQLRTNIEIGPLSSRCNQIQDLSPLASLVW